MKVLDLVIYFLILILIQFSKEKDLEVLKKRLSYWLGNYWLQFDDTYVKTKLICNWHEDKKEHDEISQVIKGVIMKYLNKRKKNKSFDLIESHYDDTEDYNTEYI
jgi:hypothetical protein